MNLKKLLYTTLIPFAIVALTACGSMDEDSITKTYDARGGENYGQAVEAVQAMLGDPSVCALDLDGDNKYTAGIDRWTRLVITYGPDGKTVRGVDYYIRTDDGNDLLNRNGASHPIRDCGASSETIDNFVMDELPAPTPVATPTYDPFAGFDYCGTVAESTYAFDAFGPDWQEIGKIENNGHLAPIQVDPSKPGLNWLSGKKVWALQGKCPQGYFAP